MDTPDLTGIRIIHRAMRGDLHRLLTLAEDLDAGRQRADAARAAAIARFTEDICAAIHHHHTREDEAVWPVIQRSAGAAVDLTDLSDDHSELDPLLDRVRLAARAFTSGRDGISELEATVRTLSEHLDEHIEEEERRIFPIIEQYVSAVDWKALEKSLQSGNVRFELAWVDQYADPDEMAHIRKIAGPILGLLLTLVRPGHRRRRRLIFGS
ncbi:hemerythrin domain-containing protein [Sphaerisporangium album]|uniref:Hemerythrin domain-containing protein n=1 Tax=Sphaerisporangium album TaxID=509200 RepID=A0A367F839_9ACTN|nr:hemerythrin domain-containing protein [Sphaerisporangium album]RCG25837.1 hemerythrin domain-containing protein [Sphaerisporangium album]